MLFSMKMGYHRMYGTCWLFFILAVKQTASASTSTGTPISAMFISTSNTSATTLSPPPPTTTATTVPAATQPPLIGNACINDASCILNNSVCQNNTCHCKNDSIQVNSKTCIKVSDLERKNKSLEAAETYLTLRWQQYSSQVIYLINSSMIQVVVTVDGFPAPNTTNCSVLTKETNFANCTGLTPGGNYTVTYSVYNSTQQVFDKLLPDILHNTTMPAIPGAINQTTSNFDASNFTLVWGRSEGLVDNYTVNVTEVNGSNVISRTTSGNSTTISLTQLRNGSVYMTVIVANRFNKKSQPTKDKFSTVIKPPPPPCNVTVSSVTNNSLNLSWTEPSDFNGQKQGYKVCIKVWIYLDDPSSNETCHNVSNEAFHATNLTSGAFYNFSVYSVNSMNTSTIPATSGVIQTKEGTPDVVNNLSVVPFGDKIMVRWSRPTCPYGNIIAYRVKASSDTSYCHIVWLRANESKLNTTVEDSNCNKSDHTLMNARDNEVNITSLKPDTNYRIDVKAYTKIGAGIETSINVTTNETAPGNVTNVTGVAVSSTEINVTWKIPPLRTGATKYFIEVYDKINNKLNETKSVTGFYVQTVSFTSLQAYWVYEFAVLASTSKGNSSLVYSDNVTTMESNPGAPVGLMVKLYNESDCNATRVDFRWIEPDLIDRKGKIIKYNITLESETGNITMDIMNVENPTPYSNHSRNWTRTLKTIAEKNYNLQIWAVTQTGLNGTMANTSFNSIACKPPKPDPGITNLIAVTEPTTSSFKVQLDLGFFRNEEQGKMTSYGIVVSNEKSENLSVENISYFEVKNQNSFPYKLNLTTWQTDEQRGIGTYTVENLPEETVLFLAMFACTKGGCTSSSYYGPYNTHKSVVDPPPKTTTIVVVTVLVLFAIIAAVVGLLLYRKGYHIRILATLRKHSGDQQDSLGFNSVAGDGEDIVKKRPIKFSMLDEHLAKMNKDSKLGFAKEYEDIQKLSPKHSTEAALLGENKSKNRWVNILAFDHSRVKLQLLDEDDPASDYINANFIPDLKRQRAYIATQGPLPGTMDDFWRMIWEHKVSTIVMLTKCKEGSRVKCEMYWPNELHEAKQYGDIVVKPVSISNLDKFDINVFDVSVNEEVRRVMHFHFQEFPDFSADVDFSTFVSFVKTVRQHSQYKMQGPVVVHCSAGVGRTGTFIAVDCLHQLVDSPDFDFNAEVDIFNYVLTMRDNRTLMVQVEQQYIMIHECLRILLEQRKKAEEEVEENLYENQAFALATFTSQVEDGDENNCSLTCPLIASNDALTTFTSQVEEAEGSNCSLTCNLIVSEDAPDPDEEMDNLYENAHTSIIPRTEL